MISLPCKNFKEKFKAYAIENNELRKSKEDLKERSSFRRESESYQLDKQNFHN